MNRRLRFSVRTKKRTISSSKCPLNIFILNIGDITDRDNVVLVKTITVDYEIILRPFMQELKVLKSGFETEWSKIAKIKVKMFMADAVC